MELTIRREQAGDEADIRTLTQAAFLPMPYSDGTEAPIIDDLRREGNLTLSLVAILAQEIVGHVAFSPVTIDGRQEHWLGLGPVSVRPDLQRRGIGVALITEGLSIVRSQGATGCVLIGDPGYYRRFGFRSDGRLTYRDVPAPFVQALPFQNAKAVGTLAFGPAFERH